eukprot:gb/GECH01013197.1/.p1 GENE.gb/GECH01013197.1/~~gb/GECH01013197.1/.p1  ORF type:complete len:376 (+),score=103.81 gb/GECH01013197.1/:1-1128(+)
MNFLNKIISFPSKKRIESILPSIVALLLLSVRVTGNEDMAKLYDQEQLGMASAAKEYEEGGACALDPTPHAGEGMILAAVNPYQFWDSLSCGMCIQVKLRKQDRIKSIQSSDEEESQSGEGSNGSGSDGSGSNEEGEDGSSSNEEDNGSGSNGSQSNDESDSNSKESSSSNDDDDEEESSSNGNGGGNQGGGGGNDDGGTEESVSDGIFLAYVNDVCSGCPFNSIALATGDSQSYEIEWRAVNCRPGNSTVQYMFHGNDEFYVKVQVRNTYVPVINMHMWDATRKFWIKMEKTSDNFFEGTQTEGTEYPLKVKLFTIDGQELEDEIPREGDEDEIVSGGVQFLPNAAVASTSPMSGGCLVGIVLGIIGIIFLWFS